MAARKKGTFMLQVSLEERKEIVTDLRRNYSGSMPEQNVHCNSQGNAEYLSGIFCYVVDHIGLI